MRLLRKYLCGLLCLVLLFGLLPAAALATDETADWAADAVKTLNGIYGTGVFSADHTASMSVSDAKAVLKAMGSTTDKLPETSGTFTRGLACAVLADVFQLPLGDESAIEYLYEQNIINGKSETDLDAGGSVTKAEFAVLTYRVLNSVGGGLGSAIKGLKPGTDAFYAWLYLAVRKCVPFSVNDYNTFIENSTISTYTGSSKKSDLQNGRTVYEVSTAAKTGKDIWSAWEAALKDTNIGGLDTFFASDYNAEDTLLEAAVKIVNQFAEVKYGGNIVVFHDVTPDSWFYDGIMYLTDRQYVIGYGDGQFGAEDSAPRYELAVLLSVADGTVSVTDTSGERINSSIQNVLSEGKEYMSGTGKEDAAGWVPFEDEYWKATATREEAVVGILKMIEAKYEFDTSSDNLAILERFTDISDIDEASKPYLAYAVSMGLLSGTAENQLDPDGKVSRAQVGVLLYRTLIGLDTSKMKDYKDSVTYAKGESEAETQAVTLLSGTSTLILREDWRLTSDLDLAVPEGTALTIDGQGKYHIYEMGGRLLNSGKGTVTFAVDTILYPADGDTNAASISADGIWDAKESNALMALRSGGYKVEITESTNGTVTADKLAAVENETVTLTVTPSSGYRLHTLTVTDGDGSGITANDNTFTMPASAVTVTAVFEPVPSSGGGGTPAADPSGQILDKLEDAAAGDTVTASLSAGNTRLDQEVFETLAGQDIILEARLPGGVTWTVDGRDIPEDAARADLDLGVTMHTGSIPADLLETVAGDLDTLQLTLKHSGEFGFPMTLTVPVGKASTGLWANLYHYDTDAGKLVFETAALVDAEGNAALRLTHASQYAIVLDEKSHEVPFTDLADGAWYGDAVAWAYRRDLMNGVTGTAFAPDSTMTRGMIVTILYRLAGEPEVTGECAFTDVAAGSWYESAVSWAAAHEIVNGYGEGIFAPDREITREETAAILCRYADFTGLDVSEQADLSGYEDAGSVSDWAADSLAWANAAGLITGQTDTTLAPQDTATRAEIAAVLMRFSAPAAQ